MPELLLPHNHKCFWCQSQANFVSVNSKKYRCTKSITKCPGFIKNCEKSRNNDIEKRKTHMKNMSKLGNKKLKELHADVEFITNKSTKIKNSIKLAGGKSGTKNPMYNKKHNIDTKIKMKESASIRNNDNIGRYKRSSIHKDTLSKSMIEKIQSGKLQKLTNTKPERIFESILIELNIEYKKQYLIQFKMLKENKLFRHCYDFYIPSINLLIEIDGDYWHNLPNIIERDKFCNNIAINKGYQLIRILQSDLEKNVDYWRCFLSEMYINSAPLISSS